MYESSQCNDNENGKDDLVCTIRSDASPKPGAHEQYDCLVTSNLTIRSFSAPVKSRDSVDEVIDAVIQHSQVQVNDSSVAGDHVENPEDRLAAAKALAMFSQSSSEIPASEQNNLTEQKPNNSSINNNNASNSINNITSNLKSKFKG